MTTTADRIMALIRSSYGWSDPDRKVSEQIAAELDASYAAQGRLESENITLRVELGKARDALEQLALAANKWRSLSEDVQKGE